MPSELFRRALPFAFGKIDFAGPADLLRRIPAALVHRAAAVHADKPGFVPFEKRDEEKVKKGVREPQRGGGVPSAARAYDIVYLHDFSLLVLYPKNTYEKHKPIVARARRAFNAAFLLEKESQAVMAEGAKNPTK
jgi:hypothetical protein